MAKTVVILGAGAHADYGYPTGAGLMKAIIDYKTGLFDGDELGHLNSMQKILKNSPISSIDSFIKQQPQYGDICRKIIVAVLSKNEKIEFPTPSKENKKMELNWYRFFFERVVNAKDNSAFHDVEILTFNYDSLTEWYIERLKRDVFADNKEACDKLSNIKIQHIYGTYSSLDNYGKQKPKNAYNSIKLIHDINIDYSETLLNADNILIFGFGFSDDNINTLGIRKVNFGGKKVFVSNKDNNNFIENTSKMLFLNADNGGSAEFSLNKAISQIIQTELFRV